MKEIVLGLIIFSLVAVLASANSYLGTEGLLFLPTANLAQAGCAGFGLSYLEHNLYKTFRATFLENVELGLGVLEKEPLYGFFKWRLLEETSDLPAFAIGAIGSDFYGVLSKNLSVPGLKGHIGYGSGILGGPFGGVSYILNPVVINKGRFPLPIVSVFGEFQNSIKNENAARFNVGGRFQFNNYFSVDIGLMDLRDFTIGAYLTTFF